jgi:Skp family chaperone for outer membrane proteins
MRLAHSLVLGTLSAAALFAAINLSPLGSASAHAAGDEAEKVDAPKIAVCAIPMLVNELMASDRFRPDREKLEEELKAEYEELQTEFSELGDKGRGMKQDDPAFAETAQAYRDLQQKIYEKQREIAEKLETKSAEQLLACYEMARSSASAVAEGLGYNYVFSSVGADEKLSGENVELALRQMMARPVVMAPKNADITEDVRADLKL